MKVVIDTMVIVPAIMFDRDPETLVFFVLGSESIQWVASSEIIDEYLEVLARPKFRMTLDEIELWRKRFERAISRVDATEILLDFPRDRKDAKFLACDWPKQTS
jgi:putative PIN family toxin of toxin-antitoxin system